MARRRVHFQQTPLAAEVAAVKLTRSLWAKGLAAVEAELRRTWPRKPSTARLAEVIERATLVTGAHSREGERIATVVRASLRRQITGLGVRLPRRDPAHEQFEALRWSARFELRIRKLLLGGVPRRTDADDPDEPDEDVEADLEREHKRRQVRRPRSLLGVVVVALEAAAAVEAAVALDLVLELVAAAAAQALGPATVETRGEVLQYGAEANQEIQVSGGVGEYIWQTQRDDRVRDRHRELEGTVQRWDDPPEIDDKGTKGNPGDAWNCRCNAVPVIPQATAEDPRFPPPYDPATYPYASPGARRSPSFELTSRPDDPLRNFPRVRPNERFVTRLRARQRRWIGLDE